MVEKYSRNCDQDFAPWSDMNISLTYEEIGFRSQYSEIMPNQTDISSKFSRTIPLKIPIVSAAMDRVTEYKMAIAMAKMGGLGIINKNLTPEEDANHVAQVKLHLNGMAETQITFE